MDPLLRIWAKFWIIVEKTTGGGGFAQARLPNVGHDAYDETAVDFDSDGIPIAKILAGQSLVDDDLPRGWSAVSAVVKSRPRRIATPIGAEVPGCHVAQLAAENLRAARDVESRRPSGRSAAATWK